MYSPPPQNLAALGPLKPKILSKTHGPIRIKRGGVLHWGTFVPREERHVCGKFHESSSTKAWDIHVQSFQLLAIAPPMGASVPNQITFFLVPPHMPPPSFVQIGGLPIRKKYIWNYMKKTYMLNMYIYVFKIYWNIYVKCWHIWQNIWQKTWEWPFSYMFIYVSIIYYICDIYEIQMY